MSQQKLSPSVIFLSSFQENIDAVLARQGGRCWTLNSAMHVLLKELDFNVTPILGSVAKQGGNDHMSNLVSQNQSKSG